MKDSPSIEYQQDFYDRRWESFELANRRKLLRCVAILDSLAALRLQQPRIIDFGCGAGWLTNILGSFGPTLGVDLSPVAIENATRKYPHIQFQQADILNWSFAPGSFDAVVSQEVIEHIEEQDRYLGIASDLLRDGGHLILTTPNGQIAAACPTEDNADQPLERWLPSSDLKRLIRRKFDILHATTVVPVYGLKNRLLLANSTTMRSLFRLVKLEKWLDRTQLALGFGLHSLVVARKKK